MANTFEYIISLKDKFSAVAEKVNAIVDKVKASTGKVTETVSKVPGQAARAFGKLYTAARDAVKGPVQLKSSIEDLKKRLEVAQSAMQKTHNRNAFRFYYEEAKKLEKQIHRLEQGVSGNGLWSKMAGWRKDFADSLPGANLIKNPLSLAGAAVGGLWNAAQVAMEAGKEKMKMQVLTGSQEIGGALYDGLTKFATDTVFGNEVYDMGAQMLANGIASADVLPLMKQLGDISMGDADKLGSLSLAFSQINSAGKLAGQDLNQMINAGFNPLQVISEKTGESMVSLKEKMGKGLITIDDVKNAMNIATGEGGVFYKMLEQVANTPYGKLEGFRGQLTQIQKGIGEVFLPFFTRVISLLSFIGEKAGPYLKPLVFALGLVSAAILGVAAAQWIASVASAALAATMWGIPVVWIVAGIIALIAAITWLISKVSGWGKAWDHTVKAAKLIFKAFVEYHKAQFNTLVQDFMIGIDKIRIAWIKFKEFIGLGDSQANQQMLADLEKSVKDRQKSIIYGYAKAGKLGLDAASEMKKAWNSLEWNDKDVVGDVKAKFGIATPAGVPGADISGGGNGTGDSEKTKEAQKTNESIATGGTKHNYITIQIREMNGVQNYNGSRDSVANKAGEEIIDSLLRIIASATTAAG